MNNVLCLNPESVYAVRAGQDQSIVHITINRLLADLSFFKLFVPCSMISSMIDGSIVDINDDTTSYPMNNWLGNKMIINTLKKFYCEDNHCDRCLVCFSGQDNVHVQVLNRIV